MHCLSQLVGLRLARRDGGWCSDDRNVWALICLNPSDDVERMFIRMAGVMFGVICSTKALCEQA